MNRQLFLHHYFPALHFAVLLFGLLLETVLDLAIGVFAKAVSLKSGRVVVFDSDQKLKMKKGILFILTTATIITFIRFAPLGYGFQMTKSQCMSLKWLPRWDWDCNSLPDGTQSVITTTGDMSPDDLSKMLI